MSGERITSARNSVASTGSRPSVVSDRGDALPKIPTSNLAGMGGKPPLVPRPPQGSRPVKPDAPRGGTPNSRNKSRPKGGSSLPVAPNRASEGAYPRYGATNPRPPY